MSRSARGVVVVAVGLASSAVFLALVLRRADVGAALDALRAARLADVLVAAVVLQVTYVVQALRWRLLAGAPAPLPRYLALVLGGIAVNNVVPLRLGDVLRGRWLAVRAGLETGRALASVFRDRFGDVLALAALLLVTLPFVGGGSWLLTLTLGAVALVVVLFLVVAASSWYSRRRPRHRRQSRSRLRKLARDALDELTTAVGIPTVAAGLALSLLVWATWAFAAWLVCRSLGVELGVVEVLFVTAVMNLGVAIPSSPGFVGTYQWLAVAALGAAGVAAEPALAFAVLIQAAWFVPTTLVGGALALVELRRDAATYAARVERPA